MSYWLVRLLIRLIIRLVARVEVHGLDHINLSKGGIVASNHLGRLDAVLVYYFLDRRDITLLVAEKYQKVALFRWFARSLNASFVERYNADMAALRLCITRLKQGGVVVLAPEGTRSPTGALIQGQPGTSYLAARLGAQIVPVAVTGTEDRLVVSRLRRLHRAHIVVRVGEAFYLPPLKGTNRDEVLQQYTDEIMCRIAAMLPPAYQGVYADHPRLKEILAGIPQPVYMR